MRPNGRSVQYFNTEKLKEMLLEALYEEWFSYYQYWISASITEPPGRKKVDPELLIYAKQELHHAYLIVGRIIQLGGFPSIDPSGWVNLDHVHMYSSTKPTLEIILYQALLLKQSAIRNYRKIADFVTGHDEITLRLVDLILKEELDHKQDLLEWINEIEIIRPEILQA
jgi:bacterioferritin